MCHPRPTPWSRLRRLVAGLLLVLSATAPRAVLAATLTPGDVDGNGEVTAADVVALLRILIGTASATPDQARAADANDNHRVDLGDAVLVLRAAVERSRVLAAEANKEFIHRYFAALSGKEKPLDVIKQYVADSDPALQQHILGTESVMPHYELVVEAMLAEGDRVLVRGYARGTHRGVMMGVAPTGRELIVPLVITYRIAEGRIVDHWMLTDDLRLGQQLGVYGPLQMHEAEHEPAASDGPPAAGPAQTRAFVGQLFGEMEAVGNDTAQRAAVFDKYIAYGPLRRHIAEYDAGFPGYTIEPLDVVAEGDTIAIYGTMRGVHRGAFKGIAPTDKPVAVPVVTIWRIGGGRVVEWWLLEDDLSLLRQLGALPLPPGK